MLDILVEQTMTVMLPGIDPSVKNHHNEAKAAIAAMSRSRRWGAETNRRSWRRCSTGWGFRGIEPGAEATLPVGAIIVACDVAWAKARLYAGSYMKPAELDAALYEVARDGLIELTRSVRRAWAREFLGWLATSRGEMPVTKVSASIARGAA